MRWPGIEPGSTAWKATMLTITPPSLLYLAVLGGIYLVVEIKNELALFIYCIYLDVNFSLVLLQNSGPERAALFRNIAARSGPLF